MTVQIDQNQIIEAPFSEALSERYLAYALSTIMARSLPDVRDGLKPVHRRILHAMRLLKLDPSQGFKKCARIVGDVMGKYHPHGDSSIYEAMVRLAQEFSVRYPLVDGQGNFGNVDGDNAAAMRYTEARLTDVAKALMEGLDEDAVDFRETYDGEDREPVVFPGAFPNLLANGATGIAVGMATSIPPHNVGELCDGLLMVIDQRLGNRKNLSIGQLMTRIKGPDFPTGGIVVEPREAMLQAYETGRGSFRLRARWEREDLGRGAYQIVATEIPFQIQKSRLIEKIAELINDKKLPILSDIRDESAEDIRIVLEPRSRTVEDAVLMESLFRLTDLEVRISLNLNVLDRNLTPGVMSLREVLDAFLEHQIEVTVRRASYRLGKIEHRMEVLDGYIITYLNLDEVIRIIREEDEPKPALIKRFDLTEVQAEAILNMRLRSLRKLEEMELKREHEALTAERLDLKALLASEEKQWQAVSGTIHEIKAAFGENTAQGARRTAFADAPEAEEIPLEAMIEKEPITVVCSKMGWVRALKGHVDQDSDIKYKEGDAERFRFHALTTDRLLLFASNGKFYTVGADKLPGGRGNGEPIRLMLSLDNDQEIVAFFPYREGAKYLLASSKGKGFITEAENLIASTRGGKQVMNLPAGARARACVPADGELVAVLGENRKLLIFPLEELPELTRGQGVVLQKYTKGGLGDIKVFNREDGLNWRMGGESGRIRTETEIEPWEGRRSNAGRLVPKGFPARCTFD